MIGSYATGARKPKIPPPTDPNDPEALNDTGTATQARMFCNWWFRYRVSKRAELERMWNRARLYDAGKQWLQPYRKAGAERLWYTWEPVRVTGRGDLFPRPVRNVFSPAMQDEVARLVGVGSKPYINLTDPDKEPGARLAKNVLIDRNEKTEWNTKDQTVGSYHAALYGLWIEESRFEFNKMTTVTTAPVAAQQCPNCQAMYVNEYVPPEAVQGAAPDTLSFGPDPRFVPPAGKDAPKIEAPNVYRMNACIRCGSPMQVMDEVPRDLWMKGTDTLGRKMSEEQCLGEDVTSTRSCYDFFPENQGVGYQAACEMEAWGFRTPRSVQWVKSRYQNSDDLENENFRDIEAFAHHPVMMTWGMGHLAAFTDGIWEGWGLLDEYYLKPCYDFPEGRSIVMWGNRLLLNAGYYHPGTKIERCNVEVAQWELRDNEIWGKPLSEDMFSAQDNINARRAQSMNLHQKFTDPKIILHEGMDLRFAGGENDTYASDIWKMNVRGVPPEIAQQYPKFWGNQGTPGTVWQEEQADVEYIATATGARAAEVGNVSGVELNYSALLFAATKSAERRKPRIERLRNLKRQTWIHRMRCIAHFYKEDRLVTIREDMNNQAVQQFRGFELMDQTDVALEDEPLVDSAVALRASIEQGLKYGTIATSANGGSYEADRKINEAIGVPRELSMDKNAQWEDAQQEWYDWLDHGCEPAIDNDSDNHALHFRRHSDDMAGRQFKELVDALEKKGIFWGRDILLPTWEWPRLLSELNQMKQAYDQMAKRPEFQDPNRLMEMGFPPDKILEIQQLQMKSKSALIGFPPQLELQIYNVWKRLLANGPYFQTMFQGQSLIPPIHLLVRFKAHLLAHKVLMGGGVPAGPPGGGPPPQPTGGAVPAAAAGALEAGVAAPA